MTKTNTPKGRPGDSTTGEVATATKLPQHTPGPWAVAEYGIEEEHAKYLCIKQGRRTICRIDPADFTLATSDRDEANARLIAAAPELLEACKNALIWLEGASVELRSPNLQKATGKLTTAIVKAEGRAQ